MEDFLSELQYFIIVVVVIGLVIMKWKIGIKLFKDTFGEQLKKGEENVAKDFYYQCEKCKRTFTGWRLKNTCYVCKGVLKEISEESYEEIKKKE